MLFTAERAAVLMMSTLKQERYHCRPGNGSLPPAVLYLLVIMLAVSFPELFFSPFYPRIVWNHCYLTIDVELSPNL